MKNNQIILANGDDWSGIFVNGKNIEQDHTSSILESLPDVLQTHQPFTYEKKWVDVSWLHSKGFLPEKIEDVQFEE